MKPTHNATVQNEYFKAANRCEKAGIAGLALQLILAYIWLLGTVFSVATSINMSVSRILLALISLICLCAAVLISHIKTIGLAFFGVLSAATAFMLIFFRTALSKVAAAFVFCYNLTVKTVVDEGYINYRGFMTEDITQKLSDTSAVSWAFYCVAILLCVVFSLVLAFTVVKSRHMLLSVLLSFAVLTPSLYFGAVPDALPFCLLISSMLAAYAQSIARKRLYRRSEKTYERCFGSPNILCCALAVFALSVSVSVPVYSGSVIELQGVRTVLDGIADRLVLALSNDAPSPEDMAVNSFYSDEVLKVAPPTSTGLKLMTVTTDTGSPLYLRGWIGDELQADGWSVITEKSNVGFNEYTQLYDYSRLIHGLSGVSSTEKLGYIRDKVTVKAEFSKELIAFVPSSVTDNALETVYNASSKLGDTVFFFENTRPADNSYMLSAAIQTIGNDFYDSFTSGQDHYHMLAGSVSLQSSKLSEKERFISNERRYSEYVTDKYSAVPDGADFLSALAAEVTASCSQSLDSVLTIERYFKDGYTYSQTLEPDSSDALTKVKCMIESTKSGYCTYYATAMTLMVRSLGIPARYVTGYSVKPADNSLSGTEYVREITDRDCHAWVEAYFDGIGWLSFDPTPGNGFRQAAADYPYLNEPNDTESDYSGDTEETPVDSEAAQPQAPGNIADASKSDEKSNEDSDNTVEYIEDDTPKSRSVPWAVITLLLLIFAAVAAAVSCKIKFKCYRKKLKGLTPTRAVCVLYPAILRLLSALGLTPQPGETLSEFSSRADRTLSLTQSIASVSPSLEMTQFSENNLSCEQAEKVFALFDELSAYTFKKLPLLKKYYYMQTVNKRTLK